MKKIVVSLVLLLAQAAMACPGSHLMTYKFDGKDAFVLNMHDGKMSRVDSNETIALYSLKVEGSEICREELSSRSKCSEILLYFTILGTKSLEAPLFSQKMRVEVTMTDGRTKKTATSTQFPGLARGIRGCGPSTDAR